MLKGWANYFRLGSVSKAYESVDSHVRNRLRLTRRINETSRVLQIKLIDHVIIGSPAPGRSTYFSFKE